MLLQQLVNGITIGCTYALVAIGFTMVFGILELVNFANSSLYMMGAYITLMLYLGMGGHFAAAFLISMVLTGLVGYSIDRFGLRRLRAKKAPKLAGLITTVGMSTIMDNVVLLFFGSETKAFPNLLDFGSFTVAGAIISWMQVIILAIAVVLMVLISLLVYRTKIGRSMRAVAQNADAARLMGINISAVISITFIIGAMLATIAGVLVGMYYQSIDPNIGSAIGTKTFASAVLGGVGVLPGAMVGGLLVGVIETIGAGYISSGYRDVFAFVILILVLLIKPSGLFGRDKTNKV